MRRCYPDVKDYLFDKLDEVIDGYESEEFSSGIFVTKFVREYLLGEDISNSSIPCSAEKAREWIKTNFSDLGDWFDYQTEEGNLQNPFTEPELFMLQVHIDCFTCILCELGYERITSMEDVEALREKVENL